MPVPAMTYAYLILLIADVLWLALAICKRDEEKIEACVLIAPLAYIGYMCNVTSIPKLFSL